LLSSKGQVSYAKSNSVFSNKGSNRDQEFRKLDIGVASSLQDIVSHGDHLGLLVQGKRRSTFWYYLIDPESSQVISKHLIEGLDFLTELRVVSVNNSDEVVIAESRKSVPLKKIKLGFVRLNVKTGDVAYQAYSSKNDDEIAVSLSCRPNQKSVPISVYSNGNDAGDSLFIDAGESRQNKLDLPGKKYIQDLAMLDREGDQASAVLVYDSIRDYMAIQTLAVVHVSDFIDCNN